MFRIDGNEHTVGDEDCKACWGKPDRCVCGGLVHAEYFDEDWDNVYLHHACDRCGENYEAGELPHATPPPG